MKKFFTHLLVLAGLLLSYSSWAQFNTLVSNSVAPTLCFNSSGTNTLNATVVTNTSGATTYTWGAYSNTGGFATVTSLSGATSTNVMITFTACGSYSVWCQGFLGTNLVTYPALSVVNVICANSMSISPSTPYMCTGLSQTLVAAGGNNTAYSWTDGSTTISTASSVVVSPTVNTCYSVSATSPGGCSLSAVQCITVTNQPTLTAGSVSSNTNNCTSSAVTLTASGATSYTWSTLTATNYIGQNYVTTAANNCYTVTGSNAPGCTATAVVCTSAQAGPVITVSAISPPGCAGNATLTATGGTGYNWYANPNLSASLGTTPSLTVSVGGVYTAIVTNAAGCSTSGSVNVAIGSAPTLTIYSTSGNFFNSNLICSGSGIYLQASGATSYTWLPGNINTSGASFFPTAATCYTLIGANSSGCVSTAVKCVSIVPTPTFSVVGNNTLCLGTPLAFSNSGANSVSLTISPLYTLSPSYSLSTTFSNSTTINCTPTAVGQYSCVVRGTSSLGCYGFMTGTVNVNPTPTISVSGGGVICLGTGASLSASGATSYTWSTGTTGSVLSVTPSASNCYSVTGTNAAGCNASAVSCLTVQPAVLTAGPASQTVCQGSSANLNASGAMSYTWSNAANTPTLNVIPASGTSYSVSGTYSNGCIGTNVVAVIVNTACSDVWPGDANSNGVVNSIDVFEIGLAYGSAGPPRVPGGNTYVSQYAANWSGTISTGKNKNHADCNGDGIVNNNDTLAIYNNYSLTHAFKSASNASSATDISILGDQPVVAGGTWAKANIMLGDGSNSISQLYGAAFDVDFDETMIVNDSIYISYPNSFLRTSLQHVIFRKTVFNTGKIYTATVRIDGANVSGSGKIAELWFKVKEGLPDNAPLSLSLSNGWKTDNVGVVTPLTTGSTALSVNNSITGIEKRNALVNAISFYPNPVTNRLTLQSNLQSRIKYAMFDVTGREILNGSFSNLKTIDLSEYSTGTYIIRFESASEITHKKFIIEK